MNFNRLGCCAVVLFTLAAHNQALLGQSWVATSAPNEEWTAIASSADGSRLAAAAESGQIYLSADAGSHWSKAASTNLAPQQWTAIACSADASRLVAVANPGAIYLSTNSGVDWEAVEGTSNAWFSAAMSSDGSCLVAAADFSGIFTSADAGATWTAALNVTNQEWAATVCSADATTLVAAADPGWLCVSTNAGTDWATSSVPILSWTSLASSADGTRLAAAAMLDGIYLSTNSGADWVQTGAPAAAWSGLACSADGINLVAAAYDGGIYTSADGGQTWAQTEANAGAWSAIACSSTGSNVATTVFSGGIYVPGSSAAQAGTYQGLFFDTNNLAPESSGFFSAVIAKSGSVSGKLLFASDTYSFTSRATSAGTISNTIPRAKHTPLTLALQPSLNGDGLSGLLTDGAWTAQLAANRSVYSKTNAPSQANSRFTLAMSCLGGTPTLGTNITEPCMGGCGTVAIGASGQLSFSGILGDGAAVSQTSFLSKQGSWPFFASPKGGADGLALGWLTFTNETSNRLNGAVAWIKPSAPKAALYPAGFTNYTQVVGSLFSATSGIPVLTLSTGFVWLAKGNLPQSACTNSAVLGANNVVTGTNRLNLSINLGTGFFKGGMVNPETGKPIAFQGVVLQEQNIGIGMFMGTNQSGGMILEPAH
jgi:hypothetical protein